jgi:hypothetical protein
MAWFAIRSADPQRIAGELRLRNVRTSNWEGGLRAATRDRLIFISPQVCGWNFIIGDALPIAPREECLSLLADLSLAFDEAQYFGTEDVTELYIWARAAKGRLYRAYAFSGEQGSVLWDRGELSKEEQALGLIFPEANILSNSPDGGSVFRIAGSWSFDPTHLDEVHCSSSTGLLGECV